MEYFRRDLIIKSLCNESSEYKGLKAQASAARTEKDVKKLALIQAEMKKLESEAILAANQRDIKKLLHIGLVTLVAVYTEGASLWSYAQGRTALTVVETALDPKAQAAAKAGDVAGVADAAVDHAPVVGDGRSARAHWQEGNYGSAVLSAVSAAVDGSRIAKFFKGLKVRSPFRSKGAKAKVPAKEVVIRGHTTEWSKMTKSQRKSFQHSYNRHANELGLPNWQEKNAESLQIMFNNMVTSIRKAGADGFFQSTEWVNGVKTTVNRTEPVISGQKYFYYETLDGDFVSSGKML